MQVLLSASILAADLAHLNQDVTAALAAGIDAIHFDVMDHHFVPNLSFGACICQSLRNSGITAPIDVHLMVDNPTHYIAPFAEAGANLLSFHPETVKDVSATIDQITQAGMQAGLVFNPDKPVNIAPEILTKIDLVLLMAVYPGFSGQTFIDTTIAKIKTTRELLTQHSSPAKLGVDGGVKIDNCAQIITAGADFLVIGSGLFAAENYQTQVQAFRCAH